MKEYIRDLSRIAVLSNDEAVEIFTLAKAGDLLARNRLIESSLAFILSTVRTRNSKYIEDLVQDANLFLCENIFKWKPEKGRLTTFISKYVKTSENYFKYHHLIHIPKFTRKQIKNNVDTASSLERKASAQSVLEMKHLNSDLNVQCSDYYKTFFDYEEDKNKNKIEKIQEVMKKLTERERLILRLHVDGQSFVKIGKAVNLHHSRVHQIKKKVFADMRFGFVS